MTSHDSTPTLQAGSVLSSGMSQFDQRSRRISRAEWPDQPAPRTPRRPPHRRARRRLLLLVAVAALAAFALAIRQGDPRTPLQRFQDKIVSLARSQLGYRTNPPNSYCNRFSAYWHAGSACADGDFSEEWCADFAAWAWRNAGAQFVYGYQPGDIDAGAYSFYAWGVQEGRWHPIGSGYRPQPGDVAVYGLDVASHYAQHVAVVTSYDQGNRGPNVVNGDGDRTGFSVVETGYDQYRADVHQRHGGLLAGYVTPIPPAGITASP